MKNIITIVITLFIFSFYTQAQEYRVNRFQEKKKVKNMDLGHNIISFTPMGFYANTSPYNSTFNPYIGIQYERIFNSGLLSVAMPINFSIDNLRGVFASPTIKLYPKKQGIAKYAIGPQFIINYFEDEFESYNPTFGYFNQIETRRQFGFGINNSLNFTISKHFYIGMDATVGILYYDSFVNGRNDYYKDNYYDITPFGNLNQFFKMGCAIGVRF